MLIELSGRKQVVGAVRDLTGIAQQPSLFIIPGVENSKSKAPHVFVGIILDYQPLSQL